LKYIYKIEIENEKVHIKIRKKIFLNIKINPMFTYLEQCTLRKSNIK